MKKGIAIQTILLLLIGVIVSGVLIYLVYSHTTSSFISLGECKTKIMNFCTRCLGSGCLVDPPPNDPCAWIQVHSEIKDSTNGCARFDEFSIWNTFVDCRHVRVACSQLGIK